MHQFENIRFSGPTTLITAISFSQKPFHKPANHPPHYSGLVPNVIQIEYRINLLRNMLKIATLYSLVVIYLCLSSTPIIAQDTTGQSLMEMNGLNISGTFKPKGPPLTPPVRKVAGGDCIVDIKQAYVISGSLSGSLEIDYRIIVHGPCEVPPIPGKYDEEWIAYGSFTGTVAGKSASCTIAYTAQVKAGGSVKGHMNLDNGLTGKLTVSGNFNDGELSYEGRIE